jgi:hypothetical protein
VDRVANGRKVGICLVALVVAGCGAADETGGAPGLEPAPTSGAWLIDFQPRGAPTGAGYLPDTGEVFAERGNGLRYGWTVAHSDRAQSFERPFPSLDVRIWTIIEMASGGGEPAWEIALAHGRYLVTVVAGGPAAVGRQSVSVEGMSALDVTPGDYAPWVKGTATVSVSDGRLSLGTTADAPHTRLCSVDIVPAPAASSR